MTLIRNLFFLFSVTIFGLTSMVLVMFNYSPYTAGTSGFINFYVSLFISLTGILSIILFYIKSSRHKNQDNKLFFWPSVRQSALASLALTAILLLRGLRILDFLIGLSIIIVVFFLELFFKTKKMA